MEVCLCCHTVSGDWPLTAPQKRAQALPLFPMQLNVFLPAWNGLNSSTVAWCVCIALINTTWEVQCWTPI